MSFTINSPEPLYKQVYNQIKSKILKGDYETGALLPSMRLLAKDMRISVITTKRAYEELEKDGYIYTIVGKGSFVAEDYKENLEENYLDEIKSLMIKIKSIAAVAKINNEKLSNLLRRIISE